MLEINKRYRQGYKADFAANGLIDRHAAAALLGITVRTLQRWHHAGRGPKRVSGPGWLSVLYKRSEVEQWKTAELQMLANGGQQTAEQQHVQMVANGGQQTAEQQHVQMVANGGQQTAEQQHVQMVANGGQQTAEQQHVQMVANGGQQTAEQGLMPPLLSDY